MPDPRPSSPDPSKAASQRSGFVVPDQAVPVAPEPPDFKPRSISDAPYPPAQLKSRSAPVPSGSDAKPLAGVPADGGPAPPLVAESDQPGLPSSPPPSDSDVSAEVDPAVDKVATSVAASDRLSDAAGGVADGNEPEAAADAPVGDPSAGAALRPLVVFSGSNPDSVPAPTPAVEAAPAGWPLVVFSGCNPDPVPAPPPAVEAALAGRPLVVFFRF